MINNSWTSSGTCLDICSLQVVRFLVGMGMVSVMMKTTMKPAFLMVEIAVDLMSTHNTAQNANVLNEGKARIKYHNIVWKNKETSILDAYYT